MRKLTEASPNVIYAKIQQTEVDHHISRRNSELANWESPVEEFHDRIWFKSLTQINLHLQAQIFGHGE